MERISKSRAIALLLIFSLILSLYAIRLFRLQIIETDGDTSNITTFVTETRVKASRGDILDRNGNILVGNRASYDLVFNHYVITSSDSPNESLRRLVNKCRELGLEYIDHFPVTKERPFTYTLENYSTAWQNYFRAYLQDRSMDSDITASLLVETLRERYKIPSDWSDADARAVIGLRYEFDLRGVVNLPTYTLMEDVSDANIAALLEMNVPGLIVEASTVREYHTTYAAHILGTTGAMTESQWNEIKNDPDRADDYYMDAHVGQSGLEAAFESYLHGVDGMRRDEVDKDGAIISSGYKEGEEPQAGNNVEITIDINLQIVAEDALSDCIAWLKDPEQNTYYPDGADVEGASVVVMKPNGEILACASYPTYNPQTYKEDYSDILEADFDPLYNRPLMGNYYPGSIYKPVTLVAAMENGVYQAGEMIYDEGIFIKEGYEGFTPMCLVYSQHGYTHKDLDGIWALAKSCNYFFYELAYRMSGGGNAHLKGLEMLDSTAKGMGLGEPTGVELNELIGTRANQESKAQIHTGLQATFFKGDLIQAAIGQGDNMFSPMQLCVYASTLANQGTRYKATFLNRVVSADYRSLLAENSPQIVSKLEISDATYQTYLDGMRTVVKNGGTAATSMAGTDKFDVAAKTGTSQTGRAGSDDGSFICFAPASDPEIVIAIQGEKAAHGSVLGQVAKTILEYYFDQDEDGNAVTALEGQFG